MSRLVAVALIGASFVLIGARSAAACSSSGVPAVTTDQPDYGAGEIVTITGSGYACGAQLSVAVTGPDGATATSAVTADAAAGGFSTTYQLGYENVSGKFVVEVRDSGGALLATTEFYDSHFRFGHLSYVKTGSTSANFTLKAAYRRDSYLCRNAPSSTVVACTGPGGRAGPGDYIREDTGGTALNFGNGSTPTLFFRVDAIDVAANVLLGRALNPGTTSTVIPRTYASPGPFVANISSCCRIFALHNASSAGYRVETLLDFTKSNVDSPQSSLPAIVDCPVGTLCSFVVPAADADANTLSFRLSTAAESGIPAQPGPPNAPNAAAISSAGLYSWNTTGAGPAGRLFATQVMIEEKSGTTLISRSAVDFIIRLVTGNPPVFNVPPTPASGSTITAPAGSAVSFTVQASDPDAGQAVTVSHLGLPSGATLACPASPVNPRACTFTWTPTAAQAGNHIVTFTAQDPTGLNASPHAITLNVPANQPPLVNAGSDVTGNEGSAIALDGTVSDPNGDAVTTTWTYAPGVGVHPGATCSFADATAVDTTITCTDNGSYTVTLTASDGKAPAVADTAVVTVANVAPTAAFAATPSTLDEGSSYVLSLAGADDDSSTDKAVGFTYAFDCGGGAGYGAFGSASTANCATADNGARTAKGSVRDKDGGTTEYSAAVTVNNVAPVVTITAPAGGALFAVNTAVNLSASFTDAGTADTHTCAIDWDDTTAADAGVITESAGSGTCTKSRSFTAAGVYTVKVTVTDDDGGSDTESVMVVVYDPSAGFVTGGGWIDSPAGAYRADPSLSGKANFGFVSKYKKGTTEPEGQTEFQFHAGSFNFHSAAYQWLVVSGPLAQYKGTGTVNGASGYSFLLTATDGQRPGGGGVDKFRIKIWNTVTGAVVYDNRLGASDDINAADPQAIGGGSIVIHTQGK